MRADETDDKGTADADLVLRSRSGDTDAFGELWQRHYRSGIVAAMSISQDFDPDDLVQEAYAKVFQAVRRGGGPTGSFRAYLFTAIRNTAASWGRSSALTSADDIDEVEDPDSSDVAVDAALDRSLTVTAFRSLPSRWQEVLWYTEVEGMKPAEVAPLLGMKTGAVSQLAFRAREGLRESWIQAHISSVPDDSDCRWTIERLGAHARDNLGARDHAKLEAHIGECPKCSIVASEAEHVGSRLVMVLLPLAVGVTGAGGYLATLQRGGEQAMAFAAMPDAVVQGSSVVAGESVGPELFGHGAELFGHLVDQGAALIGAIGAGAAGLVGAGAASPGGAASSGGASSSGGFLSIAGIVTAGAASLAIAAVVAAATVLPAGWGGPGGTSSALGDSAAAAEVAADDSLADASKEQEPPTPPVTKKPAPDEKNEKKDNADEPAEPSTPPPADETPAEEAAAAPVEEPPTDDGDDESQDSGDDPENSNDSEEPKDSDGSDGSEEPEEPAPEFTKLGGEADWSDDYEEVTLSITDGTPNAAIRITSVAGGAGAAIALPAAQIIAGSDTGLTLDNEGALVAHTLPAEAEWRENGVEITVSYADPEAPNDVEKRFHLGAQPMDETSLTFLPDASCATPIRGGGQTAFVTVPITLAAQAPTDGRVAFLVGQSNGIGALSATEQSGQDNVATKTWDALPGGVGFEGTLYKTRPITVALDNDGDGINETTIETGLTLGDLPACE